MHNLFAKSYYHQIDFMYVCHYFINIGKYLQSPFFPKVALIAKELGFCPF
jgi:hypothetical protein